MPAQQTGLSVTGKFASRLSLPIMMAMGAGDGGGPNGGPADGGVGSLIDIHAVWTAYQRTDNVVEASWLVCGAPIAGLAQIPIEVFNMFPTKVATGMPSGSGGDRLSFTQPDMAVVLGARLADPAHDALPADGSVICADKTQTGCVIADPISHQPGVAVRVSGLTPDVDLIYFDFRLRFSLSATLGVDGKLDGTVGAPSLEAHVLGCELAATQANCSPADVARLEAQRWSLSLLPGQLRSHAQGPYFSCPQFEMDADGAVNGTEVLDGGVTDSGLGKMSWVEIQTDLDERGCATGGCHEAFSRPDQMKLIFRPRGVAELQANYQSALPWAHSGAPPGTPGGALVNQVPLPAAVRARWLRWIEQGSPF